jgi:phosphoribosyl-dephospho-CoA transferase
MFSSPSAHDLLRISVSSDLICSEPCPAWVAVSLERTPMVVVRRAETRGDLIPVGVRGHLRSQRFAALLGPESIRARITPEQLTGGQGYRAKEIPAFETLAIISLDLCRYPLVWGPTGSAGFELATGVAATTIESDLDLLIRTPERLPLELAEVLIEGFTGLPCRVDAQLETPCGAVSLSEYVRAEGPLVLRTNHGPRLVSDPWNAQPTFDRF